MSSRAAQDGREEEYGRMCREGDPAIEFEIAHRMRR